ncbi:MAG: AbgT family transporter [Eubacteriales bacterium]|nr:AbgT family transporter [Eubacteriales bacterium]
MAREKKEGGLNVNVKSFITAIAVIFVLMVMTYVLTLIIPGGAFDRDANGEIISGSFHAVAGGIPFVKWILSPFLVLTATGSGTIIAVIIFLLVIGGVFNALGEHGLMKYMLGKIVHKYGSNRRMLMAVIMFFFMAMGAMIGSFEECVPLVPIVVALAISLGWDSITGMGMSILAAGCGFASGVCNPFTVGVAQNLVGLPMFSGLWLRLISFILIYALLWLFVSRHAGKIERPISSEVTAAFTADKKMDRGLLWFVVPLGIGVALVLSSSILTFLQDYTMIIVAVMFLVGGIAATLSSGMTGKELGSSFLSGVTSMLPAVLMILMASSIKYTLETACILDTVLNEAVIMAQTMPRWVIILFIYLIVLVLNFFIASGSAKAFMLIPLIVPMAEQFGIPAQLCIMAFAFGDGFSNVFYPTNPVLLISLGLADLSYDRWFKWSIRFQLCNLLLTSALLLFGLAIGYGM